MSKHGLVAHCLHSASLRWFKIVFVAGIYTSYHMVVLLLRYDLNDIIICALSGKLWCSCKPRWHQVYDNGYGLLDTTSGALEVCSAMVLRKMWRPSFCMSWLITQSTKYGSEVIHKSLHFQPAPKCHWKTMKMLLSDHMEIDQWPYSSTLGPKKNITWDFCTYLGHRTS